MNDPFITIDLHGLLREDAMRQIDRALRDAGPYTYQLRLVHGFHRGTSLRSMIQDEYRFHEKVLRIQTRRQSRRDHPDSEGAILI